MGRERLGLRIRPDGLKRLRELAAQHNALAKSGIIAGQPSVSELLDRIVSGELVIVKKGEVAMARVNWRNLEVHEADGYLGHLGELVDDAPANLDNCELAENGSIDTWPQHMVAAPGEEPDWNTPRVPVDWSGFAAALAQARGSID